MKNFTKNDLSSGDFIQLRDGRYGVVVRDIDTIVLPNGTYLDINYYNTDLKSKWESVEHDIMKVYRGCKCFDHCKNYSGKIVVYDREQDEVEEMTLEEVCKALGKNVKIVKEK